jgi:hypothetical protein
MADSLRVMRQVIRDAVRATAVQIAAQNATVNTPFAEKNLKAVFKEALASRVATASADLRLEKTEYRARFEEWPGVGGVDVAIVGLEGPAAYIELKWGRGTLYNCVWDVAKMALASAKVSSCAAFLVAGSPNSEWTETEAGSEFFATREWSTWDDNLIRHRKHWNFWATDVKTRPISLPKEFRTISVIVAPLMFRNEPWDLRAVEVSVSSTAWIDVTSGVVLSQR